MSFVERNLISGEIVCYKTRFHWVVLFWPSVFAFFIGLVGILVMVSGQGSIGMFCIIVAAAVVGSGYLRRLSAEFAVTNKRVIIKVGVIQQRTLEMFLNKIESVGVVQSLFGRIMGFGTIVVRGTGGTPESFHIVPQPLEFRRQVQEQIESMNTAAATAS